MSGVDEFVDNQKVVEAEEVFLEEGRVYIGRVHEGVLDVLAGGSGNGHAAEVEGEKGVVAEVVHLHGKLPTSPEYSFLLLLKPAASHLRNPHSVVKNALAYGLPLHMFQVLLEQKMAHLLLAFVDRSPVLDNNVSLWKSTTERDCQKNLVDVELVKVILIVADGMLPISNLKDLSVPFLHFQFSQKYQTAVDSQISSLQLEIFKCAWRYL